MTSQNIKTILALPLLLLILLTMPVGLLGKYNMDAPPPDLKIVLRTDKTTYMLEEEIEFEIQIHNLGRKRLYVYDILSWGRSASLQFLLTNEEGQTIETKFFDDSVPPPPNPGKRDLFLKLSPGYFFGTTRMIYSLDALNLTAPGKYHIQVEFHTPISRKWVEEVGHWVKDFDFWAKEDGAIRSNTVTIAVKRRN